MNTALRLTIDIYCCFWLWTCIVLTYNEKGWNKSAVDAISTTAMMFVTSFNKDLKLKTDVDTYLRNLSDAELNKFGRQWIPFRVLNNILKNNYTISLSNKFTRKNCWFDCQKFTIKNGDMFLVLRDDIYNCIFYQYNVN